MVKFDMYAKNSSGVQRMYINEDCGGSFFTLVGDYKGMGIQIDFDTTSVADLLKMRQAIDIVLENIGN